MVCMGPWRISIRRRFRRRSGGLSQQAAVECITVCANYSNVTAFQMRRINENVPSRGHDDGRDAEQGATLRNQPFVPCSARLLLLPPGSRTDVERFDSD